ncbi:SURF1 family protein [Agromyces sp. MMS24-JH15]|uniref:SURF1 family cytochrome oxidase biogenesis protein n=1 Tax=Agromyces sp. MMS24-JH15 TaxID=3243765 RepID=UPI00374922EC
MSIWRLLGTRRWLGYLALVIAFAIACSALGTWQLNRRAEALTEIARIDANYDASPTPVVDALPDRAAFDPDQRWLVVALGGRYLADEEVVIRNRPYQGASGFQVVTPFLLEDGTVFFVDRGWVAQGSDGEPAEYAAPEAGQVEIAVRLKAGEGTIAGRTSVGNQLATIDLAELADRVGEPSYTGAYGILIQTGADASEAPLAASRPARDEGPHLSYSLQWFVFALIGFVGFGWALRQDWRTLNADDPAERERADAERERRRAAKARTDAAVEDEILDRSR